MHCGEKAGTGEKGTVSYQVFFFTESEEQWYLALKLRDPALHTDVSAKS